MPLIQSIRPCQFVSVLKRHAHSSAIKTRTQWLKDPFKPVNPSLLDMPRPLNLAIMGAPGVGKGTFATRLSPLFDIPTISTGDLIRAEIKLESAIGREVREITENGGLVDDEIVMKLLEKRLNQRDATLKGFLIDGYPRRVSQAETLAYLRPISLAVYLTLDREILVEKALARRVCEDCGTGYNLADIRRGHYDMPPLLPKQPNKCDKCGGKLVTRADDTEEIIRNRLAVYDAETQPIVDYYRKQGKLMEFEVKKGVKDLEELTQLIKSNLKKQQQKQ